ncbi:hypothetical protein F4860DRAFT_398700 [Xylaria cubensis]|nr:hypothetical protein F4860DRAFT_398700 [Xylaria cubensis]
MIILNVCLTRYGLHQGGFLLLLLLVNTLTSRFRSLIRPLIHLSIYSFISESRLVYRERAPSIIDFPSRTLTKGPHRSIHSFIHFQERQSLQNIIFVPDHSVKTRQWSLRVSFSPRCLWTAASCYDSPVRHP